MTEQEYKQISLTKEMILSELALIEKHLKFKSMQFYKPHSLSGDIVYLQKTASNMMKFVGLNDYIPLITFVTTEESEGGNIELDYSKNVYIQISNKYRNSSDQILAIMAHEICHKVLFLSGLYYPTIKLKNEILTDLATMYVGFGKLSLNGCYHSSVSTKIVQENGEKKQITTTYHNNIGYITPDTFAIAYNLVCSRFNISSDEKYSDLNSYANGFLRGIGNINGSIVSFKDIKEELKRFQSSESETLNNIIVIEQIIKQLRQKLNLRHSVLYKDLVSPFINKDENLTDLQFAAQEAIAKHRLDKDDFISTNKHLKEIKNLLYEKLKGDIDINKLYKILRAIECPKCGYINSSFLKENRTAFVKCPKCNHIFLWDGVLHLNEDDTRSSEGVPTNKPKQKDRKSFVSKLFSKKK